MASVFVAFLLVTIVGVVRPFGGWHRRYFVLGVLGSVLGFSLTVPPVEKTAGAKAPSEAAAAPAETEHDKLVTKAAPALEGATRYTRKEFPDTYRRVGKATFAMLGTLEPGAAYAAAESKECDKVLSAMVSDRSRPGKAVWFVDCANENRFMVGQSDASAALARYDKKALAERDLAAGCTLSTVSECKKTPAQRDVDKREGEFVTACDLLLQEAVISPSSLSMRGMWSASYDNPDKVTFRRAFDSQNAFGATIRSHYRCDVDLPSTNISRFEVRGPTGTSRFI